jgi:CheY-like chemotaxis protein
LTRQLLAFSRKQVTDPVVLDPNAIVEDTRKMLRRMVGEDITLETSLDPDLQRTRIDAGNLVQILMNLAVNARDAMPEGGVVRITTRNAGDHVMLSISDTGCGMSAELQARIFEPFFTTKGVGRGTGMGLAVVHGIVEQARGKIEIDSTVGVGTTFRVVLPAAAPHADATTSDAPANMRGDELVLMVDDDDYVRRAASRALRSRGYNVLEAGDGEAALKILEHSPVRLLVTDIVMPGMDGRQLADAARKASPALKVLYTSGYTDDTITKRRVRTSRVAFIEKPFRATSLASKVRQVLDAAP